MTDMGSHIGPVIGKDAAQVGFGDKQPWIQMSRMVAGF
jgi:hypothetical protein